MSKRITEVSVQGCW